VQAAIYKSLVDNTDDTFCCLVEQELGRFVGTFDSPAFGALGDEMLYTMFAVIILRGALSEAIWGSDQECCLFLLDFARVVEQFRQTGVSEVNRLRKKNVSIAGGV
jgi:hypothetical protein